MGKANDADLGVAGRNVEGGGQRHPKGRIVLVECPELDPVRHEVAQLLLQLLGKRSQGGQHEVALQLVVQRERLDPVLLEQQRHQDLRRDDEVDVGPADPMESGHPLARDAQHAVGGAARIEQRDVAGAPAEVDHHDACSRTIGEHCASRIDDVVQECSHWLVEEILPRERDPCRRCGVDGVLPLRELERCGDGDDDPVDRALGRVERRLVQEGQDPGRDLAWGPIALGRTEVLPARADLVLRLPPDLGAATQRHGRRRPHAMGALADVLDPVEQRDHRRNEVAHDLALHRPLRDVDQARNGWLTGRGIPDDLGDRGVRRAEVDADDANRLVGYRRLIPAR